MSSTNSTSNSSAKSFQYSFSNVAASPGVSLERGKYRMRVPNTRPLPSLLEGHAVSIHRSPKRRVNHHLVFLIMLLAASCLTCFGYAYYLFSARWAVQPTDSSLVPADSTTQATGSEYPLDHRQRYLSYLPHSGFHNQRIAFENALVLAYALNRTILVPPIRLGNEPIRYIEYDTLSQYHEVSDKKGLKHCPHVPTYVSRPPECLHYFEASYIPWTWLVNLSAITARQTLFHLPNMSRPWIYANLDIGSSDIHTLQDKSAYQFRFIDDAYDSSPHGKYEKDISIDQLDAIPEKLLQIGTLFGTARLHLRNAENIAHRASVRKSMTFANKKLLQVARTIVRVLQYSYIAVHIRSGDGVFQSMGEHTVNSTWWKTLHEVLGLSVLEICKLEISFGSEASPGCIVGRANPQFSTQTSQESSSAFSLSSSPLEIECLGNWYLEPHYRPLNIPLYVATDLSTPQTHQLLSIFRQTFPCIFFLSDFKTELAPIKEMKSPYDAVELYKFALPFVDALVAGHAMRVVGTEGSTFINVKFRWKLDPNVECYANVRARWLKVK